MIKKIIILVFLLSIFSINSFSQNNENYLKFIGFIETDNSSLNKVSYNLKKDPQYEGDEKFIVEMLVEGKTKVTICKTDIQNLIIEDKYTNSAIFQKITCEFKKERGKTTFVGKVIDTDYHTLNSVTNTIYYYEGYNLQQSFKDLENEKTLITITINSEYENILLKQTIPKNVISYLSEENKDKLIESNLEYKILESDPLIAWNIETTPTKINYTINKKISDDKKEEFRLELDRSSIYKKLEYGLIILIIIIVILIFKPTIIKRINKKSK